MTDDRTREQVRVALAAEAYALPPDQLGTAAREWVDRVTAMVMDAIRPLLADPAVGPVLADVLAEIATRTPGPAWAITGCAYRHRTGRLRGGPLMLEQTPTRRATVALVHAGTVRASQPKGGGEPTWRVAAAVPDQATEHALTELWVNGLLDSTPDTAAPFDMPVSLSYAGRVLMVRWEATPPAASKRRVKGSARPQETTT